MKRTKPELAPPLQTSAPHQREGVRPQHMIWRPAGLIHDGSSVESGFEPATLRSRGRDLSIRPPRPLVHTKNMYCLAKDSETLRAFAHAPGGAIFNKIEGK
ncbi:hypothetical protein AVEN_129811-1 [Araneus ventricosus]|uniref:Uncharacterized protein n=1 Tax=Araneus ventricosus TaxID=182803 RepID=A0A4Y2RQJ7_ARAVE|nr:hypothetical protein AVEN_129811-1 [Araneus ventricosus]